MNSVTKLALVIVCLAAAGFLVFRGCSRRDADGDVPGGVAFYCEKCEKGFRVSMKEFAAIFKQQQDASTVPCPTCGGKAVRAAECTECGALFPATFATPVNPRCPACKATSR